MLTMELTEHTGLCHPMGSFIIPLAKDGGSFIFYCNTLTGNATEKAVHIQSSCSLNLPTSKYLTGYSEGLEMNTVPFQQRILLDVAAVAASAAAGALGSAAPRRGCSRGNAPSGLLLA